MAAAAAQRARRLPWLAAAAPHGDQHSQTSAPWRRRPYPYLLLAVQCLSTEASPTEGAPAPSSSLSPSKPPRVVIIGSGPAAHTAAIYLGRAQLQPTMYEGFMAGGMAAGGQLTTTQDIENYPGFTHGIDGGLLMEQMRAQSERFGTTIVSETIARVDLRQRPFRLWREGQEHDDGAYEEADALIVATGATAKRLHLPGEERLWQKGISACAVCDGALPLFRNQPLLVVGGGDSAAEEALFLTKYASRVYVAVRRDVLRASKIMAQRLQRHPKVEILWQTQPVEAVGDALLDGVVLRSTASSTTEDRVLPVRGLFYAIGHRPNTALFKETGLTLDKDGYVVNEPGTTYTNIPGLFVAGDVADKRYRQAITAAGTGCQAALDCEHFLMETAG
ncbi:hypothetical protein CXG81DRAFT_8775 [Caulochytrium protostelioides]|uniref:Thioredoxin reductase n=1 Tax=Caulochytrium protostelioides TaxID=1555241 RepID=A0A4P9XFU6_9FUNG|nr:hypothetical protein CXG81DRAFT_8775 [Caulochytrium protostelioides]|eukprot:RKP04040.1 hypothetical protein CXG81DRAFT_8775 [Caulochytrium protostelioides]